MADQQPGIPAADAPGDSPAATPPTTPDPTRVQGHDRTRLEQDAAAEQDATAAGGTAPGGSGDAAARWSGSAVVPPHVPKRPWWSRRRAEAAGPPPPVDPWAGTEDWSATPAVDPWADQDTPWQAEPPFPEAMPPTRIDRPVPPTRMEPALPPAPPPPAGANVPSAASRPPANPPAAKRRWGRRNRVQETPAAPANRLPVQPRLTTPAPPPPQQARPAQPPARPAPPPWKMPAPGKPPWQPAVQSRPPAGPAAKRPPAPPRRKRRWGRRLFLFTLFSLLCCCGVPGYFAWPAAQQYPVSAVLPQSVSDLDLRDDGASRRAIERLTEDLSSTDLARGDVFAGIYTDGNGKKVTVFGTTGLRITPEADVEAEIAHLTADYHIKDIETYDLGETGLHERCGVGRTSGSAVVVCAWADHGSLATVMLTRRSVEESAELTGVLRGALLTRG